MNAERPHRRSSTSRAIRAGAVVLAALVWISGCGADDSAPPPFSRVIVFGDSLSDVGNIRSATGTIIPQPPYFEGHFSNGRVWIEHVASHFGWSMKPSFFDGNNNAYGGALSGDGFAEFGGIPAIPNVLTQIDLYQGQPDGTELFVIWAGGNDLFDTLSGDADVTPDNVADNLAIAIISLYQRGARNFLVATVPDVGSTPRYIHRANRAAEGRANAITANAALDDWLELIGDLDGIQVLLVDSFALFDDLRANPPDGITNTTDSAYSGGFTGGGAPDNVVPNPEAYFFWDSIHPTARMHGEIARIAIDTIAAATPADSRATPLTLGQLTIPGPVAFWFAWINNLPVAFGE